MTSTATQRNSKVIASNPPITNGVIVIWFWFLYRLDEDETSERKPKQSEELVRIICCSWGISQTTLWQKAHSRLGGAARPGRTPSTVSLNLFLISGLHFCRNSQQFFYDTVTVVHTFHPEAV